MESNDCIITQQFFAEYHKIKTELVNICSKLGGEAPPAETLKQILRGLHTIKGNLQLMELGALAKIVHAVEDQWVLLDEGKQGYTPQLAQALLDALDRVLLAAKISLGVEIQPAVAETVDCMPLLMELNRYADTPELQGVAVQLNTALQQLYSNFQKHSVRLDGNIQE
jgi:chemotaxis protein histidine kinase CheA